MGLTRPLTSFSRHLLRCTTKAARPPTLRTLSSTAPTTTNMGALNGQTKQDTARTNLVGVADRLEEGRALAQDVWSVFKYVTYLLAHLGVH